MEPVINVQNLRKVYRIGHERVVALDGIDLQIEKGQIICILGPSGSGKSTLLNQLAGLEKPTSGDVYIGKRCISKMTENQLAAFRQKHIGFIFQSYNLLPNMTALENVAMPLMFRGMGVFRRNRLAADMLKKVDLGSRMRHKPTEMSGGQQQRVGIARAFVARPTIVFADEPTGNLDTRTTYNVMKMIIEMTRLHNITFILVTHDAELAQYADRIITLLDGSIVGDKANVSIVDREGAEAAAEAADTARQSLFQSMLDADRQAGKAVDALPPEPPDTPDIPLPDSIPGDTQEPPGKPDDNPPAGKDPDDASKSKADEGEIVVETC